MGMHQGWWRDGDALGTMWDGNRDGMSVSTSSWHDGLSPAKAGPHKTQEPQLHVS